MKKIKNSHKLILEGDLIEIYDCFITLAGFRFGIVLEEYTVSPPPATHLKRSVALVLKSDGSIGRVPFNFIKEARRSKKMTENKKLRNLEPEYNDHPLFAKCIGATIPPGWLGLIEKLVIWLDEYNVNNKTFIGFAQIKLKFDRLTIYVEHYIDGDYLKYDGIHLSKIREKIAEICNKSESTCKVCGKEKTELVVDSRVKRICLEHMESENNWWRKNE